MLSLKNERMAWNTKGIRWLQIRDLKRVIGDNKIIFRLWNGSGSKNRRSVGNDYEMGSKIILK